MHDLFHALHQPLTALHCALELAQLQPGACPGDPGPLRVALGFVAEIARLTSDLRELWQSSDAGDQQQALPLTLYLQEVREHFSPIAALQGIRVELHATPDLQVNFEPWRLRQALFRLLEFVFADLLPGGAVQLCAAGQHEGMVQVAIVAGRCRPAAALGETSQARRHQLNHRLQLAIAGNLLRAAGGGLDWTQPHEAAAGQLQLTLSLPAATHPAASA
jgi:hypothetical protein